MIISQWLNAIRAAIVSPLHNSRPAQRRKQPDKGFGNAEQLEIRSMLSALGASVATINLGETKPDTELHQVAMPQSGEECLVVDSLNGPDFARVIVWNGFRLSSVKSVEPTAQWNGIITRNILLKAAPEKGFLADAKLLAKVWKAWRPKEEVPTVDFTKELILVGVAGGPNSLSMQASLDLNSHDLQVSTTQTLMGGTGFGYQMLKISREGVKTVNGTPVEANGVRGVVVIPENIGSFKDHTLEITLFEYDLWMADKSATVVDQFRIKKYSHQEGRVTETPFSIGKRLKPRAEFGYYIGMTIMNDGKRTHIDEPDEKNWLSKVLTQGNPSTIKLVARPISLWPTV